VKLNCFPLLVVFSVTMLVENKSSSRLTHVNITTYSLRAGPIAKFSNSKE